MTITQQIDLGSFLARKRLTVPMFLERYNINGSTEALQGFIRAGNWVLAPELLAEIELAQNKLLEASAGEFIVAPDNTGIHISTAQSEVTTPTTTEVATPVAVVRPKAAQKKPAKAKVTAE